MAAHGAGLIAAAMLLLSTPFRDPPEKPWQMEKQIFVPPALAKKLSLVAVAGLAVLVAGQTLHQPKTFAVTPVPTNIMAQIYGGLFAFNLYDTPLIGEPEAPCAMVSLFDYTCHHCRIMHGHLMEAHRTFSNKLAIVSLPMPLNSACNPTVKRTPSAHSNACEYARIGLALWRANRKVHAQFDDWVFTPETPPPLNEARAYATLLAGKTALAMQDPWIDEQMARSIAIYSTNLNHLRNGNMPQIIISNKLASGTLSGVQELYRLLAENLGLKPGS
jgi:hypothetical protein